MRHGGRSVIITGAGSGIGKTMALAFAREGASVVVPDIDAGRVRESVQAIERALLVY